ncbi:hypothetical protein [cf. Phormidesmis sp. LEGE 11477]|uniref:hypothetical protein n=1 Tax=cf. Phormidesmis sp. LEGE 11477 TaxID=1828680 RepID=UPI001881D2CD|nr:hypothetical protein [cf. Phormidesmis sp. LEGE 11477]MBE9063664.1 hypothetical protein [cf. Phormidesmis sp. LEGE 11477]
MNELVRSELTAQSPAIQLAARNLKKEGYAVVVEPDPSMIPFDLRQYQPSILATRDQDNLIIDIRPQGSHRSIERYKEISDIISSHKDWRFMLSTIDDVETTALISAEPQANLQSIDRMLWKIESLLSGENFDLTLPYIWSVYISAMRIIGGKANIPMDTTSDRSVLNYMYSLGEISYDEYELGSRFLALRNRAVHSLEANISKEEVLDMYRHVRRKLLEWELIES